eukprot:TRINITY_DN18117_c2_g1_i2.p1 TRINITY_DN18117_c2_g1~~TRINITY_DN18117_c2_g1_i2.p1  ORF type:complete len:382 (-),score=67.59 TRINITY_DN18117_c2_g1_i2:559-1704(-)
MNNVEFTRKNKIPSKLICLILVIAQLSEVVGGCPCLDVPPPRRESSVIPSCEKQKSWGKCDARWMEGWCQCTCETCPDFTPPREFSLFDDFKGDQGSLPEYNISTFEERTRVNITSFPFSIIGQLGEVCTAALIGPCQIITAAHCLMDPRSKTWWADFNSFSPGRNGYWDWNPHGRIQTLKTFVPQQWKEDFNTAYDIGIVQLDQRIGDELGYFDLGFVDYEKVLTNDKLNTQELVKHTLGVLATEYHDVEGGYRAKGLDTEQLIQVLRDKRGSFSLAGYPATETDDSMYYQYCHGVTVDYSQGMLFLHLCEAGSGVSGGPMWRQKSNGRRELVAIHGGEVHLRDSDLGLAGSYATLITEEMKDVIKGWMKNEAACLDSKS